MLTPEERAELLNDIQNMLEEKGYNLSVAGYEDDVFFSVLFIENTVDERR